MKIVSLSKSLFAGKIKKDIISLSSAEFVLRVVNIKYEIVGSCVHFQKCYRCFLLKAFL